MSRIDPDTLQSDTELDRDFICPICRNVLWKPVVLGSGCSHMHCYSCILTWAKTTAEEPSSPAVDDIDSDETVSYPINIDLGLWSTCPTCRRAFSTNNLQDVELWDLDVLRFSCPYSCGEVREYSELNTHMNSCPLGLVNCGLGRCKEVVLRRDLNYHQLYCPFSLHLCKWGCRQYFYRDELIRHYLEHNCIKRYLSVILKFDFDS